MNPAVRVLAIIPGTEDQTDSSMIFARRQVAAVAQLGTDVRLFFLASRTSPWLLWREWQRIRKVIREFRPHTIHAHFGTVTGLFAVIAGGNIPVVITYRGSDLNPSPRRFHLRAWTGRLFSQWSARSAAAIVCVSEQLKQRLWFGQERVTVLPSGVDTMVFRPQSRAAARRELGWADHERVVLFNAGHDPVNKRLDLAQAAVVAANERMAEVRLEIMTGKTDPRLVPMVMNAADCLLVTSDSEGSPTVVQEALATNLPIISVAVGDVPARVEGVAYSHIVERDPSALAEAILATVAHPLRSDGRKKVDEFSALGIAQSLCALYRNLVETA